METPDDNDLAPGSHSEEMDVDDYDEVYENARKALQDAQANERESSLMRAELSSYVGDLSQKKSSDGTNLIRIPSNFDTIVNSMSREDLVGQKDPISEGEKPWSQYLLLDSLNAESDMDYKGRYNSVFNETPDLKIQRGLAQIQLLDRQLKEASRKHSDNGYETMQSNRQKREANSSLDDQYMDDTFITKVHQTAPSPRTGSDGASSARGSSSAKQPPRAGKESISPEQQRRLEWLLSGSEEEVAEAEEGEGDGAALDLLERVLGPYMDPALLEESSALDAKLAAFGRLDRLLLADSSRSGSIAAVDVEVALPPSSTAAAGKQAKSSSSSKDKRNETLFPHQQQQRQQQYDDYLQEQREEREQNLHAARVDHMLQKCTQQVRSCRQCCCCCCLTLVFVKPFLYYFCVQPIQYSALLSSRKPGSASGGPGANPESEGVAVGASSSAHGDDPRSPSQASQVSRQSAASSHRTRTSLHLHAEHSSVACGVDDVPLFNEVQ
jgi:hypothetical protein